jgi:hypothetical protein
MTRNRIATAIAFFLMFAMAVSLFALPTAFAQTGDSKKTYAYIGAIPNPAGVGQEVLLHVGITHELASVEMGWDGLSVTIEKPDGTTETISNIRTDATGGTGKVYTPNIAGTYYLQTHFPEQLTTATKVGGSIFTGFVPEGTKMLASVSDKLALVVQEQRIDYYPGQPLPTEYWTRPIDAQLREWSPLAGSWIWGSGMFGGADVPNHLAPYNNDAPETAHVLWAKPFTTGGVAGGTTGEHSMSSGDAYEGKFPGPLMIEGKLYYTDGGSGGVTPVVYHCVDVHTGEELWAKTFLDNRTISFGQLLYWDSFNYHAVFSYLWITTGGASFFGPPEPENWYAFDPFTGDWRITILNVPSGTTMRDPNGGLYRLVVDQFAGRMALWNFTAFVQNSAFGPDRGSWGNSAEMRTFDAVADPTAPLAWSWNVTIPTNLPGFVQMAEFGDKIVGGDVSTTQVVSWALSLKQGQEGSTVYAPKTWNAPADWAAGNVTVSWAGGSLTEKVFLVWDKETREWYGFSTETGNYLWKTEPQWYLDYHVATENSVAYGKLFSVGVSGIVYCYNLTTGQREWTYELSDPYQEILWANDWWGQILFVTDGKIYVGHSEHSPINPLPRGAPFVALDIETGEEIFRVDGMFRQTHWGGMGIIGDSVIVTQDTYDQRVYAVGKGPSALTVTAPNIGVDLGKSVLVSGTVTDVSPGMEDAGLKMRFPNGIPAVSDASMSQWMLYVYKQFPQPTNATGVEVVVEVLDPNHNYYEVGRTTSDATGFYSAAFTPEVPGKYTIVARFAGSKAYWGSYSEAAITVDEPVEETTPEPTAAPATAADLYLLPGIGAIIAAIAVVGAILVLMLRRK